MNFGGKVILVTGGSSGIGADVAVYLSKQGASLAIVGRDADKLHGVAQQIINGGYNTPLQIVADVNKDAKLIINSTVEKFGKLDVLVNNAGMCNLSSLDNCSVELFDRILNSNIRSVFELSTLAIPHLIQTKGNIVNVSSICGLRAFPCMTAYCTSKAAQDQLTKCMALELGSKGIRVNAINPGVVRTSLFDSLGFSDISIDKYVQNAEAVYPMGRIGKVEDTSLAIAFLAHESTSFITGQLLVIDGGYTLSSPIVDFN